MMKRLALSVAAMALMAAPGAEAQITVIGNGLGKDCYEAVKYAKTSFQRAEDICNRALSAGNLNATNRSATYVNRGIARMRDGRYDAALSDYAKAERLNAEKGPLYLNRGAAHIYKKDFTSALTDLNTAIDLGTQDVFAAYYNRAIAKENTGDVQGAYFDFKKALELKPDFRQAELQLQRFTVTTN